MKNFKDAGFVGTWGPRFLFMDMGNVKCAGTTLTNAVQANASRQLPGNLMVSNDYSRVFGKYLHNLNNLSFCKRYKLPQQNGCQNRVDRTGVLVMGDYSWGFVGASVS